MFIAAAGATTTTFLSTTTYYCFHPPFPTNFNASNPIFIAPKAKQRDDSSAHYKNSSTERTSQFPLLNLKISSKLLIQSAVSLFALGFVDAGYSGDWSRIGVISKDTEQLLKMLAFVVAPLCIFLVYTLSAAKEKDT